MADLSDKFGALMARMAKTDAELFRTIGDHNKAVTEQVMDLTTEEPDSAGPLAITPPPLLPSEERSEAALKGRFKTCKAAFEWIEQKLGTTEQEKVLVNRCPDGDLNGRSSRLIRKVLLPLTARSQDPFSRSISV